VRIDIWSDVVCPWCYIGKARFDRAMSRLAEHFTDLSESVEIVYRAYQLDPTAPVGRPTPVRDVYARKFGGPERADAIFEQMTATAAAEGIQFDFPRALRANTSQAHRLLWWSRQQFGYAGQSRLKEQLMAAYFTDGRDVGDVDTLADIAVSALSDFSGEGSRADSVRAFLLSNLGSEQMQSDIDEAAANGITGVPTYVIDGQWAIPGAQDSETFERVLRRSLERRQSNSPE
jgi:predicted DsbA family dithiol-disulfide isomerase